MEANLPRERRANAGYGRWIWAFPVALALLFAGYHIWDLRLRSFGTGLSVRLASPEEVKRAIEEDTSAIVLDIRLHGGKALTERTLRVPRMELERRIIELESYRKSPIFVLAASEEEAVSTAAPSSKSPASARLRRHRHKRVHGPIPYHWIDFDGLCR